MLSLGIQYRVSGDGHLKFVPKQRCLSRNPYSWSKSSKLTPLEGLDSSSSSSSPPFSPSSPADHSSSLNTPSEDESECPLSVFLCDERDHSLELLFWWGLNMLPYFQQIPTHVSITCSAPPLDVKVDGCQVMISVIIIWTGMADKSDTRWLRQVCLSSSLYHLTPWQTASWTRHHFQKYSRKASL